MSNRGWLLHALLTLVLLSRPSPAGAGLNGCMVGKLGCLTHKVTCLLDLESKARASGTAPDAGKLQACRDRFDGGGDPTASCFAKVEATQECFEHSTAALFD